jgi:hypothetical protein
VGTELEQRQRELARKSQERPASPEDRAAIEGLQKRFTELQEKAGQFVAGNEMALLYQRHGGVGLNAATGKDLTRYMISLRQPPALRLRSKPIDGASVLVILWRTWSGHEAEDAERRHPSGLLYEPSPQPPPRTSLRHLTIGWESDILSLTPTPKLLQSLLRSR